MSSQAVWITNGARAARVAPSSLGFWRLRGWLPLAEAATPQSGQEATLPDGGAGPETPDAPEAPDEPEELAEPQDVPEATPAAHSRRFRRHEPRRDSAETLSEEATAPQTEE